MGLRMRNYTQKCRSGTTTIVSWSTPPANGDEDALADWMSTQPQVHDAGPRTPTRRRSFYLNIQVPNVIDPYMVEDGLM